MAHFYAFDHHYGPNIREAKGMRVGTVVVFDNKRDRDAFCYEDAAEPITNKIARKQLLNEIRALDLTARYDFEICELFTTGAIDEIISMRNYLLEQWNAMCEEI